MVFLDGAPPLAGGALCLRKRVMNAPPTMIVVSSTNVRVRTWASRAEPHRSLGPVRKPGNVRSGSISRKSLPVLGTTRNGKRVVRDASLVNSRASTQVAKQRSHQRNSPTSSNSSAESRFPTAYGAPLLPNFEASVFGSRVRLKGSRPAWN